MATSAGEKIEHWFESQFPGNEVFLVDVQVRSGSRILIHIDGLAAVSIKECSVVSRALSLWLDTQDSIGQDYTLEVSTAGAESPLKNPLQFHKHIGREVKVKTKEEDPIQGILQKIEEEVLILQKLAKEKGKKSALEQMVIPLAEITSLTVVLNFKEK